MDPSSAHIVFQDLIPLPLDPLVDPGEIWNKKRTFSQGQYYLVNAGSGRGKTTLLNILYGSRNDYKGQWFFQDKDARNFNEAHWIFLRNHRFAYLFQDLKLFPQKTGIENLEIYPHRTLEMDKLVQMAKRLDIAQHLHRPVKTLSLGQQQRLAAIRTLSRSFQWLLLDEPFSHLDNHNTQLLMECFLQRAQEENAGIIATSLGERNPYPNFNLLEL